MEHVVVSTEEMEERTQKLEQRSRFLRFLNYLRPGSSSNEVGASRKGVNGRDHGVNNSGNSSVICSRRVDVRRNSYESSSGLPPINRTIDTSAMMRRSRNTSSRSLGDQQLSVAVAGASTNVSREPRENGRTATVKLCCDKCDGRHATEACPHFKKDRESHPDGQKNFYKALGGDSSLPGKRILSARVIRQPGDGNCLFHSMSFGLGDCNATSLRLEICEFIRRHPNFKICETTLQDWIKWDSRTTCSEYARKMSRGSWGGGIEMAVCSRIRKVNIHVYQKKSSTGYTRISAFDYPENAQKRPTLRILYQGGVHYDALSI